MNYIYGELNNSVIPINYSGVDTDTAETIVDNENRTIQVNVKQLTELIAQVSALSYRVSQLENLLRGGDING